jgi:glycogen debranching enzyme
MFFFKTTVASFFIGLLMTTFSSATSLSLDSLRLAGKGTNHLYSFTNKEASFFVGETNAYSSHWGVGFTSHREKVFTDYKISVASPSDKSSRVEQNRSASEALFYPHKLVRIYAAADSETVFMPDNADGLVIQSSSAFTKKFELSGESFTRIRTAEEQKKFTVLVIQTKNLSHTKAVAIAVNCETEDADINGNTVSFGLVYKKAAAPFTFAIALGTTDAEAVATAKDLLMTANKRLAAKKSRLEKLLSETAIQTSDKNLNKAFAWAICSFDALNMNENGKGIYAGLPWFNDYWGRDSFIALRALTVTGQFELAKENLRSFLRFQILSDSLADYGKIPNRVRPDESIYNTADATPRFIIETNRYLAYSGDVEFAKEIFPNLEAAISGTLKNRTDEQGFLTHGDADSWMDARGPKGPYSPRGNRANDIQALWIEALQASVQICQRLNPAERNSIEKIIELKSQLTYDKVHAAFEAAFVRPPKLKTPDPSRDGNTPPPLGLVIRQDDKSVIYDALTEFGEPREELRPNQIFCADVVSASTKEQAVKNVFNNLATPFGLLSLAESDAAFHPFHQYEPVYEQDASYHNGIIWLWNTGELVSKLSDFFLQDKGFPITKNYASLILNGVALGTLPELIDAAPRVKGTSDKFPDTTAFKNLSRFDQLGLRNAAALADSVPVASGAFSQAWSLSEFIRNFYEDYFGVRFLSGRAADGGLPTFFIRPALPKEIGEARFTTQFAGVHLAARYAQSPKENIYELTFRSALKSSVTFQDRLMSAGVALELEKGETKFVIRTAAGKLDIRRNGKVYLPPPYPHSFRNLAVLSEATRYNFTIVKADVNRPFMSQTKK